MKLTQEELKTYYYKIGYALGLASAYNLLDKPYVNTTKYVLNHQAITYYDYLDILYRAKDPCSFERNLVYIISAEIETLTDHMKG